MNRGVVSILVIFAMSAVILFLTYTLLYGDNGDSKHFSRPVTPDLPRRETGNNKIIKTGERSFSDQFLPSQHKLNIFNPRSSKRHNQNKYRMPQLFPDPDIHYYILEMKVREDIDYKINRSGR